MVFISPQGLVTRAGIESGTRQGSVFGVGISFIVFITIIMTIRIYVRIVIIKAVGADDSKFALFQTTRTTN